MSDELLGLALKNLNKKQITNTLHGLTLENYRHILAVIDHDISKTLRVGLDLKLVEWERERVTQLIRLNLTQSIGVEVSGYQDGADYDLLVTNRTTHLPRSNETRINLLSDVYSSFDLEGIKKEIQRIRE